jgi:hypothetical protein
MISSAALALQEMSAKTGISAKPHGCGARIREMGQRGWSLRVELVERELVGTCRVSGPFPRWSVSTARSRP